MKTVTVDPRKMLVVRIRTSIMWKYRFHFGLWLVWLGSLIMSNNVSVTFDDE